MPFNSSICYKIPYFHQRFGQIYNINCLKCPELACVCLPAGTFLNRDFCLMETLKLQQSMIAQCCFMEK